jgi:hypothetical protein
VYVSLVFMFQLLPQTLRLRCCLLKEVYDNVDEEWEIWNERPAQVFKANEALEPLYP